MAVPVPFFIAQTRTVRQSVPVTTTVMVEAEAEVTFVPRDLTRTLTVDELEAEVLRRGYKLKGRHNGTRPGVPNAQRLDEARWLLGRGRVADALFQIELALPATFSGLADEVARFYGQRRSA